MTSSTLAPMQAHVLLLLSLEPQSVTEVTVRLVQRNHVLELSSIQFLLNSLVNLGVAVMDRDQNGMRRHYRLAQGVVVEEVLEQAYQLVNET